MKRFTIIFSVLLVLGFAGTLVYVGMSPDFEEPAALAAAGEDPDAPVWGMGMDDMVGYLEEKGLWDSSAMLPISPGVATEAYNFDGAELYWWDVENLTEGSDEEAAYQDIVAGEPINLYQKGQSYMSVTKNGPFALTVAYYSGDGDPNELMDAFQAFGQNGGGTSGADDRSAPVWSKTLDELAAYLAEQGVVDPNDYIKINYNAAEKVRSGYRFSDLIDIVYYDFEQMDDSSDAYQEYDSIASTGTVVYVNGDIGYFYLNGPFTLHFYEWGKEQVPEEEQKEIIEIFQAFGKE